MRRILFFIRKCLKGKLKECKNYCGSCPYYERCRDTGIIWQKSRETELKQRVWQ